MLKNRSRAVTTKQSPMADHNPSQPSSTQILYSSKHVSSFFNSHNFRAFTSKINSFESDRALISPTSMLDAKASIFAFCNTNRNEPFCCHESRNPRSPKFYSPEGGDIGLAHLVSRVSSDGDRDDPGHNKTVLFGSKLRIQIPQLQPNIYQDASTKSPGYFGTKTRDSRHQGQEHVLPVSEMVLSEDYTCVISHGPNPKTTHIFQSCVVFDSHYSLPAAEKSTKLDNFLGFCYTCKKNLDQKHDIYISRGEKAFCSSECWNEEMLLDEMES